MASGINDPGVRVHQWYSTDVAKIIQHLVNKIGRKK